MRIIVATVVGVALCSGCVSIVDVKKAAENRPGLRYYLPQVFLRVTPGTDGTVQVDTEFLPDPRHEYTINTYSFFGNYTVDINRSEQGFLEAVTFNADSSGVAKQLLSAQANLKAEEINAQAAKAKTDAAEAKATLDKQNAAVAAAEKLQGDTELAVQVAEAKLKLFQDLEGQPGAPANLRDQVLAARIALAEAVVRRDAARVAFTTVSANVAAANGLDVASQATAPSPVFLKVVMTSANVGLVRQFEQKDIQTWKIPSPQQAPVELEFLPSRQVVRPAEKTGALSALVQGTKPVHSAVLKSVRNVATNAVAVPGPGAGPVTAIQFDRTTVRIDMPKETAAGEYALTYEFQTGPKDKPVPSTQVITLRIEK